MKKLRAFAACLAVAGSLVVSAPTAQAAGACYQSGAHAGYSPTYTCAIWRSNHLWSMYGSATFTGRDNTTGVLGAGNSWFVCQRKWVVKLEYGPIKNDWFAYTLGDNGYWGWVNAAHFSAGGNWEPVPGLGICPGGFGETANYPGDQPRGGTRFDLSGPDHESNVSIN
ncbi:hypothetical protein [Lentzea sp. NPDC004782]|uniref:hypothetical protein n=1 Tax=Lentzea sp. NPDC004782 TaxID=3154458 RepID=UPI0033ADC738